MYKIETKLVHKSHSCSSISHAICAVVWWTVTPQTCVLVGLLSRTMHDYQGNSYTCGTVVLSTLARPDRNPKKGSIQVRRDLNKKRKWIGMTSRLIPLTWWTRNRKPSIQSCATSSGIFRAWNQLELENAQMILDLRAKPFNPHFISACKELR